MSVLHYPSDIYFMSLIIMLLCHCSSLHFQSHLKQLNNLTSVSACNFSQLAMYVFSNSSLFEKIGEIFVNASSVSNHFMNLSLTFLNVLVLLFFSSLFFYMSLLSFPIIIFFILFLILCFACKLRKPRLVLSYIMTPWCMLPVSRFLPLPFVSFLANAHVATVNILKFANQSVNSHLPVQLADILDASM